MGTPVKLAKAELRQLSSDLQSEINKQRNTKVQFNPETLKVSFANQIQTPTGASSRQFVGAGTTKLSLTLFFDVSTADQSAGALDDVRKLTQKVAYFITPQAEGKQFIPPVVRFLWGSFQFDGIMDSLEENLEFFSGEGKPLRASMTVAMSQQRISEFTFRPTGGGGLPSAPGAPAAPGTQPLIQASAGATVQGLAAEAGIGDKWQDIASANGIENPRILNPGQLINLTPPTISLG